MPVAPGYRLAGLIRDGLPSGERIGVALSGGGDSTALLHLCLAAGIPVEAVTVDHRLRMDSAEEAASVAADCARLEVGHEVRVWAHGQIAGNLMDQARLARMRLIGDWARGRGITHVALGHTRDDQAETLLMGLARRAGIAGLSGMRRRWEEGGITFHRPLLDAGRGELRDWLRARGVGWIDDPTNENERFLRVKARKTLAALEPLGITPEGLAEVAGHLADVQRALQAQVASAAARLMPEVAGALRIDVGLQQEAPELRRQIIRTALAWLSGAAYPPRATGVDRLMIAIAEGRDATLAGCRYRQGWLMREARALGGVVRVGQVWDERWLVEGSEGDVRALGGAGLRQCSGWRETGLPREVLAVTPGIWEGERLIAAPLAGLSAGYTAQILRPFHLFGLSH